jgi:hypothetical protein
VSNWLQVLATARTGNELTEEEDERGGGGGGEGRGGEKGKKNSIQKEEMNNIFKAVCLIDSCV